MCGAHAGVDDQDKAVAVVNHLRPWLPTLVERGVLIDQHMSFWLARPSESHPTVEVRAADTAATADDAVLQAVLTRGLVQTALRMPTEGIEGPRIDDQVEAAAVCHGTGATRQRIAAPLGIGDLVGAFRLTSEGMPLSAGGHDCSAVFAPPRGSTP